MYRHAIKSCALLLYHTCGISLAQSHWICMLLSCRVLDILGVHVQKLRTLLWDAYQNSEEMIFGANTDSQNRSLTCVKGDYYTIDFTLPIPANAFWFLTLYSYNNDEALVTNAIDQYSIDDQVRGNTRHLTVHFMCCA